VLSTFTVNSTGDAGTSSGDGTGGSADLRWCINEANANNQANTIVFDATKFSTPQTIMLGGIQLELKDTGGTQAITGPAAGVTIDAGGQSDVFQVDKGVTASLSGLTLTGGGSALFGGGLDNSGTVTLTGCTLSGNSAGYDGGGLANFGTATLTDCTISGNTASDFGGGLFNCGTATLTLTGCTLSGNSATSGGGLFSEGSATLTGTTVSGNSAVDGGGIDFDNLLDFGNKTLTITTSTIRGNKVQGGAGTVGGAGADGASGGQNVAFLPTIPGATAERAAPAVPGARLKAGASSSRRGPWT
jgi:hypothetical protein